MTQDTGRSNVAVRVILLQILVAAVAAVVIYVSQGWIECYSLVLGALAGIVPTGLFALLAFNSPDQDANMVLTGLYAGLLLKYLLTAGLFILIILLVKPVNTAMVLAGLILTQVAAAIAPAIGQTRR